MASNHSVCHQATSGGALACPYLWFGLGAEGLPSLLELKQHNLCQWQPGCGSLACVPAKFQWHDPACLVSFALLRAGGCGCLATWANQVQVHGMNQVVLYHHFLAVLRTGGCYRICAQFCLKRHVMMMW
jgi:hypothetical protein